MKWYGFAAYSINNIILKNKKKQNLKIKNNALFLNKRNNFQFYKINFFVPLNWNFFLIKHKNNASMLNLYLFSSIYFFSLPFVKNFLSIKCNKNLNTISLQFFFKNNFYTFFWNHFKYLFYSFSVIFFKKLKFKGKGYYIFKTNRNTIAVQMGYSHIMRAYSYFVNVKFVSKTVILMFGVNNLNLIKSGHNFFKLKPINVFTGRGIRFARQIIYRKTGKVSSYR